MSQAISGPIPANPTQSRARIWTLDLGSIGVVYGDIGTSPLYAFKESLTAASAGGQLTEEMPTAIAGLYGMNFKNMPERHWEYGYFDVLGVILTACAALYWRFRRVGWL